MYSDWTTTFFGGLAVEFWVSIAPQPSQQEIAFLESIFTGPELLDVACGAGRFAIPLAASGYRMSAIDGSPAFLDIGRRLAPSIDWHEGDIRRLSFDNRFDGALCFGNSFAYFPRDETNELLRGIARALRPGAPFVLETGAAAESLLPSLQLERRIESGGFVFSSQSAYDAKQSRLDIEYTFLKNGRREVKRAQTWIYTVGEITQMMNDAGLTVDDVYASAAREDFTLGSPRAIFVTRCIRD